MADKADLISSVWEITKDAWSFAGGGRMLHKDYREMLSLLLEEKVKFIIVGAYALSAHGYPKATGDIDKYHPSE